MAEGLGLKAESKLPEHSHTCMPGVLGEPQVILLGTD